MQGNRARSLTALGGKPRGAGLDGVEAHTDVCGFAYNNPWPHRCSSAHAAVSLCTPITIVRRNLVTHHVCSDHACMWATSANQRSRGMVDEGIQVSVHGLAGPLLRCVLPRGSTLASLRQAIKEGLGIPNRVQTLIIGGELVSPLEALDAVCCRDCVDITLVLCQPACDRCGQGDSLYCSTACQRAALRAHKRVCVRPRRAMGVIRADTHHV